MSTLYLVSTPIGNLDDLSPRAAEVLRTVDRILAEDTRRTKVLTDRVGSGVPLVSLHAHNERERVDAIVGWLDAGESLALVSDAGTPLVSDPGARVVSAVVEGGHGVVPIPGPNAPLAALVGSGLPTDRFVFLGFIARKGGARAADVERIAGSDETVVVFESPHRLVTLLESLGEACEDGRRVTVARELTKIHEEFVRGTLPEVAGYYREHPPKGEVTVVVGPALREDSAEAVRSEATRMASDLLRGGMKPSAVARELAKRLDLGRNDAYRMVHELAETATDE